jgi:Ran GTPase-activating protein (RanGAP) involved in mRNA processing and transport
VITDTSHKSNDKTLLKAGPSHTISTKSSQSIATEVQQSVLNLTKTYHNQKLETLIQQRATLDFAEFRERQLNDEDAHLIANELARNTFWKILSLAENHIGAAGTASLSTALESNSTLQILQIENNQLGDDGATCLASALKVNKTLEELRLRTNQISDAGAKQLAKMLEINKSLKHIDLRGNEIGDLGMTTLAASLPLNTVLKNLNLMRNKITDRSVDAIVDVLLRIESLDFLRLQDNQFSSNASVKLGQAAKQSKISVYL